MIYKICNMQFKGRKEWTNAPCKAHIPKLANKYIGV
jgi:hypothetical protein